MKALGSLILSILFGIVMIILFVKLLGAALKLVAVLIGIALAVAAYFFLQRLIGKAR